MKRAIRRKTAAKSSLIFPKPDMSVSISRRAARQIADHAALDYPEEACGLFAGRGGQITKVYSISNTAAQPTAEYQLAPVEQLRAIKQMDADKLDWLGVYHSHPKSAPIPSPADCQQASDDRLLHLIVSLKHRQPRLKLWRIKAAAVTPVPLHFDTDIRQPDESLSGGQKIAIVLAGVLSLILMLAIALTLLPPAPALP